MQEHPPRATHAVTLVLRGGGDLVVAVHWHLLRDNLGRLGEGGEHACHPGDATEGNVLERRHNDALEVQDYDVDNIALSCLRLVLLERLGDAVDLHKHVQHPETHRAGHHLEHVGLQRAADMLGGHRVLHHQRRVELYAEVPRADLGEQIWVELLVGAHPPQVGVVLFRHAQGALGLSKPNVVVFEHRRHWQRHIVLAQVDDVALRQRLVLEVDEDLGVPRLVHVEQSTQAVDATPDVLARPSLVEGVEGHLGHRGSHCLTALATDVVARGHLRLGQAPRNDLDQPVDGSGGDALALELLAEKPPDVLVDRLGDGGVGDGDDGGLGARAGLARVRDGAVQDILDLGIGQQAWG